MRTIHSSLKILFLTFLALVAGCFESEYPLGEPQSGKLDLTYIGNWELEGRDDQGQPTLSRLIVRNLRNTEYYIEWHADGDDPFRATAWLSEVAGATFVNMLPLSDDGTIPEKFFILRLNWESDQRFTLEHLDPDFFRGRKVDSPDALRKIITENLKNDAMYTDEPLIGLREP